MDQDYQVEKILARKVEKGVIKYLLKWEGYPESESTWELAKNLDNIKQMIEKFESSHPTNDAKEDLFKKKPDENLSIKDSFVQKKTQRTSDTNELPKNNLRGVEPDSVINLESNKKTEITNSKKKAEVSLVSDMEAMSIEGNIEFDIPLRVIDAKISPQKQITCLIEWKPRFNKTKPSNSYVPNTALKDNFAHLLLDFYELKILQS